MKYKWCTVTQELHTPGFSNHNIQCYSNSWLPGQHSQTTPNRCLTLWAGTPTFCIHDLPYLGRLMLGEGTQISIEISPHLEIHGTTTFQLIHFGISGERNFKTRQICAFSYGWVCHSVTNVLHFAGDRVVSLFGMQNIIYEKLNRILQWLQFLHKTFFFNFPFSFIYFLTASSTTIL